MEGVRRVPYHLADISQVTTDTIYWVEGEKDADTLWECGRVATTSPGGANAWKPEYSHYVQSKNVCIIPDNDSAGLGYAKDVARALLGKANLRCVLLEDAKDITEWLDKGGDVARLPLMEQPISALLDPDKPQYERDEDAIIWNRFVADRVITFKAESIRQERTGIHARVIISCDYVALSWSQFNVERSEERTRLANSAYSQIKGDIADKLSKEDMRASLDAFCLGLWDFQVSGFVPEPLAGDTEYKPLVFVLKPYIVEGGGTILFAPPGRGKSFTALLWAISANNGISTLWPISKATVTLFINLERSRQSISRRLAMVNRILGLPANHQLLTLNARGKSLHDVMPACRKAVKKYGVKLIVLDSISRAGFGDLNENRPVNAIIDSLSSLCDTWLALGHCPRASENHLYGSVMADAGADVVVQLSSQIVNNTLGVGYEITKSNDIAEMPKQIYALEFGDVGLDKVRLAKPVEFPNLISNTKTDILGDVTEYILEQDTSDATATEIENALGYKRYEVSKIFTKSGKFVKTRRVGPSVYYGVKEAYGY